MLRISGLLTTFLFIFTTTFAFSAMQEVNQDKGTDPDIKSEHSMQDQNDWSLSMDDQKDSIPVDIDVLAKDSSDEARTIQVVLFGSESFDVNNVDHGSVTLADAEASDNPEMKDHNNDGFQDVIYTFSSDGLDMNQDGKELTLKGNTSDDKSFIGSDTLATAEKQ